MNNETTAAVSETRPGTPGEAPQLDALMKYQKRLVGLARIRTLACLIVAAVFVLAAVLIGPRLDTTLDDLQASMSNLNTLTAQLNEANVPGLMREVQVLIEQGQVGISQAILAVDASMQELASLDIESLNAAIADFAEVSEALAKSKLLKLLP